MADLMSYHLCGEAFGEYTLASTSQLMDMATGQWSKEIFEALQLAGEIGNVKIKRIDEKRGDYVITEEIINHIKKASLIICDLTEERPNVYFELGYARAIGKKIILCAKEGTKLHFDVKQNHFICYKSSIGLQNQIIKELKAYFPRAAD